MENPGTLAKLETLWRPLTDSAEEGRVQARLDQTWRALQWEVPSLVERLTNGDIEPDLVADVIHSATLRILQNPEGLETFDRALDDYREGGKYGATSSNDLYFTAAELRRVSPRGTGGAFTITPGPRPCSPTC